MLIRVPRYFYEDHEDRGLDTPVVIRKTLRHIFIDSEDQYLSELLSDAIYYSDPFGFDGYRGLCSSARATVNAIRRSLVLSPVRRKRIT